MSTGNVKTELGSWNELLNEAERKLRQAKEAERRFKTAIRICKVKIASGEPFPAVGSVGNTATT